MKNAITGSFHVITAASPCIAGKGHWPACLAVSRPDYTGKARTSTLFPWRSPFVLRFAIAKGGIEVQLFRNGRRITHWHAAKLRRVLPESLVKWIDENQFATGPRPHPLARQLWQYLSPLASQKLLIDVSELAALKEVSQPAHFALIWEIDQVHARSGKVSWG